MKECDASKYCLKDGDVLIDKGYDCDSPVASTRSQECAEIIDEIESGESFGQIRNRHKQFVFWYRRNVIEYMSDHKRLKCQSSEPE